ncbi:UNVERIFIED_CONTAM: hypothetical protein H355_004569 [Colinus virginianus]|nr:hypothetical protein H355_004569 [Colinus virginianus]
MPVRRPYSSVHPPRQLQHHQNQNLQQCDSRRLSRASAATGYTDVDHVVLFDTSKKERGDPSCTYRQLARQLEEQGVQIEVNCEGSLSPEKLRSVSLVVLAHPSQPFSNSEMKALREFLNSGKSVLCMLGEGGEREAKTNINYFLEEYGLTICSDTVVRTIAAAPAYLHPKETLVTDGFLCRDPAGEVLQEKNQSPTRNGGSRRNSGECSMRGRSVGNCTPPRDSRKSSSPRVRSGARIDHSGTSPLQLPLAATSGGSTSTNSSQGVGNSAERLEHSARPERLLLDEVSFPFVFPYGATVSVQPPAFPFLSSGLIAFPARRPLGAAYVDPSSDGRLVALGSYRMFDDTFLHKENNRQLQQLVFAWLLREQPAQALRPRQRPESTSCDDDITRSEATGDHLVEADLAERSQAVPDTASMAERVMPCFQESEHRLPLDFHDLHEEKLYSVNLDMLPEVKKVYKQLNVKYEPLSMIEPEFEVPLPRYIPAVHPPLRMALSPPPLELFDLDEELASPRTRLAQLTNRCTDADLGYYVREAAHIVRYQGAEESSELGGDGDDEEIAKKILWGVFAEIATYKSRQAAEAAGTASEEERKTSTPNSSACHL